MTASQPLWQPGPPAAALPPEALPDEVEIAVLGGDLEAQLTALFLARGGARVALLCAEAALGTQLASRDTGIAAVGYAEPPERLVHSVGEARCRELLAYSARAVALLEELGLVGPVPVLHAALGQREEADLDAAIAVLQDAGLDAGRLSAEEINAGLGSTGMGPGLRLGADRALLPLEALATLEGLLAEAGVQVWVDTPCSAVDEGQGRLRLRLPGGRTLRAELAVLVEGWRLLHRDPWFADKLVPTRTQALATAPGLVDPDGPAFTAQLGYLFGQPTPEGRLVLGGCRWATQHLETWETDDTVISELVDARLLAMLGRLWPHLAEAEPTHRWTGIMTFTCDNLPVVGPLPGRARLATLAGFNGRPWSLAAACARSLADGLLDGRPTHLPAMMRSDRFL